MFRLALALLTSSVNMKNFVQSKHFIVVLLQVLKISSMLDFQAPVTWRPRKEQIFLWFYAIAKVSFASGVGITDDVIGGEFAQVMVRGSKSGERHTV